MKVISIALFGDADRKDGSGMNYHAYMSTYALAFLNLFPREEGWNLNVFVDKLTGNSTQGRFLSRLQERQLVDFKIFVSEPIRTQAMLWRMTPVFTDGVDFCFPRDIDCIPMPRDRAVCDVFIASNCAMSTCHDSSSHAGIMGGLCGFGVAAFKQATGLNSLADLYTFANKSEAEWAQHGTDQHVLNRLVDATPSLTLLEHRYNGWHAGPGKLPPRGRGEYRCKAMSTPTPDVGKAKLTPELRAQADLLANHLGAAGYDIDQARVFWEKYGDPTITQLVRDCEQ